MKVRYSTEVLVQNGKIRRSTPIGLEHASDEQRAIIDLIKPLMHSWLRSRVSTDVEVLVQSKYIETSNGLTVEFKVQSVQPVG